jgi:hypothetical protein
VDRLHGLDGRLHRPQPSRPRSTIVAAMISPHCDLVGPSKAVQIGNAIVIWSVFLLLLAFGFYACLK